MCCCRRRASVSQDVILADRPVRSVSNYFWRRRAIRLCSSIYQKRQAPMRSRKARVIWRTENTWLLVRSEIVGLYKFGKRGLEEVYRNVG